MKPPETRPRQANQGLRGPSGGVSSAVPANLAGGARLIHGANRGLLPASALEALYEHFCASCQYGSLTVGGLFGQYQRWMGLNDADVAWLEAVGRAFAAAGGSGSVILADVALEAGLRAAGVSVTRADIQVSSPTLSGIDPATGYIEDPVNSATGNFVLPETDVVFSGPSQGLAISRMYNSTLAAAYDEPEACGVLGPGWSTILDQRLIIDDEQVRWVRDDGREIVFPLTDHDGASGSAAAEGCHTVAGALACRPGQCVDFPQRCR